MDKEALRKKYIEERDKRLREDGNDQYITLEGKLSYYKKDPYTEYKERSPVNDHVKFVYVGGGFAGLCTGAGVVEAGIAPRDIRIVEKGGDVIPKVVSVNLHKRTLFCETINFIQHCPYCESVLSRLPNEANHYCLNSK